MRSRRRPGPSRACGELVGGGQPIGAEREACALLRQPAGYCDFNMNKTCVLLAGLLVNPLLIPLHAATATFTGPRSERVWPLKELNPELPADWTPYDFLVIEFKASSSQRFELGLETAPKGRIVKAIHPFAGVWVRASIPLRYYRQPAGDGMDMAATYNQPRSSYWINIHTSGYGPTTNVQAFTVAMQYPAGSPTLEIRSVSLAKTDPGDAVLEGKPLVDEFGQYTRLEWPGKAHSINDLQKHGPPRLKR